MRTLERTIGTICRKVARRIVTKEDFRSYSVKPADLEDLLGPAKFAKDKKERRDEIGLVNGLAWTSVGGELLPIEVAVMNGTGKIQLTGSLGDVMKESATTAITCIRTRAETLGISPDFYAKKGYPHPRAGGRRTEGTVRLPVSPWHPPSRPRCAKSPSRTTSL